jgi:glycosyltransferase involved in cell wall biosynthesis
MQPKVSIVIPVYNVEKYLRQCLDSVVNQTLQDIQIICVNDGSPDGSLAILQQYADRDSRIVIIDKPNGGISSARNAAYSHIRGKYTLFVDSDDWIELDLCEKTYRKTEETDAAMTVFFDDRASEKKMRRIAHHVKTTVAEKLLLFDFPTVWSKLWRTSFLLDNKLYFPVGLYFEDNLFNWQAVTLADKIAVLHERLYHHRRNNSSITQTMGEHSLDKVSIFNMIRKYLVQSNFYATYREKFISQKLDVWFRHYRNLPSSLKPRFLVMIRDSLTDDDRTFYRSAPKKRLSNIARLFYAMIEGGTTEAWNFHVAFMMNRLALMPERVVNRWIVRPMRRLREAA